MLKNIKHISFSKESIFGGLNDLPLEQRVLNGILILSGSGNIMTPLVLPEGGMSSTFSLALYVTGTICVLGYIASRFWDKFLLALILLTGVQISIITLAWFENGGLRGVVPICFIVVLMMNVQFYPSHYIRHLIVGAIVLFLAYVILELHFTHLLYGREVTTALLIFNFGMMITFSFSILLLFKSQYKKWEKETLEKEKKLALALEKEKELNAIKNQFISIVSHQFRTPMTIIQSSAQLIALQTAKKLKEEDKNRLDKQFNQIYDAIDLVTSMMERILDQGKIESGQVQFKPSSQDLVQTLNKIIGKYQSKGKYQDLKLKVLGTSQNILFDQNLMEHSIDNLISNAIKYDPQHRTPDVSIDFQEEQVIIAIKDRGIGIPKEEQEKLFSPFFRANNVSNIKGTGVGLSVVKRFVELHQGTISVESEENEGSCFYINLPLKPIKKLPISQSS
ncbi:sensor histidine kinase [Sediminitomix flava]|uniref:histidine kinase n=1 Tax=Sediminitomix flava TaxID=379075 RepID=A0A315ZBS2_SEDFL|nr:HAMP domain-containing sensor histidine kinase [Sediminitomix flava]PWJ43026.1 phospho-acceptor domain-containing protein [Sediminitomix flava]